MRAASSPSIRVTTSSSSAIDGLATCRAAIVRSSRSRNFSRSCRRASSAATIRRNSRTSACSKPLRDVVNAADATALGDDGSGRVNEMAIGRESVGLRLPPGGGMVSTPLLRGARELRRLVVLARLAELEPVAAALGERRQRLVERCDGDRPRGRHRRRAARSRCPPRPAPQARGRSPRPSAARPTSSRPGHRSRRRCRRC